jgi:hypothetical protein
VSFGEGEKLNIGLFIIKKEGKWIRLCEILMIKFPN